MMVKNLNHFNHLGVALAAAAGVLAAVGMLMLMLLVGVEPAGAAFPGQNGKIAFASSVGNFNSEIFTVNVDGTGLVRLTNNTVEDRAPAWSPDRNDAIPGDTLIAFSSERDGHDEDIYTINPLGIKIGPLTLYPTVPLTNDPGGDSDPAWSPDGKKIAFTSNRDGYYGATGDCMLHHPCNHEIYTMNADGTGVPHRLTYDPVNRYVQDLYPAWSPDGKKIAFTSDRDGNREIYSMNPDGSNQKNLTNDQPPQDPAHDSDPAWSPDGKKIAFTSDRDGESNQIYTMNADGTGVPHPLTSGRTPNGTEPAWSPNGEKIAFRVYRDGKSRIYTMNVYSEESDLDLLTNETPGQYHPDWQSSRSPQVCPVILCPHQGG